MPLRRARREDSAAIAALHRLELPGALFTRLGDAFMVAFYRYLIDSPIAFAFVAEGEGRLLGFAACVVRWRGFYRGFMRRHLWLAARVALASLRGGRWRRLLEVSRYVTAGDLPDAELLSLAVDRRARGMGVGRDLTRRVLEEFRARGAGRVRVTSAEANAPATRVYLDAGFQKQARLEMHPGEVANVFVISLNNKEAALRQER